MSDPGSLTVVIRRKRGRPPTNPTTPLARFLTSRMSALGLSRQDFATRLGTTTSTVSRLLNGQTTAARGITESRICKALELTGMNRREFLRLARAATAFTMAASVATLKHRHMDLDLVDDRVAELYQLMRHGEAEMVLRHAQRWHDQLAGASLSPTDPRAAAAKVRVGLVLGAAQEVVLPWYRRAPMIIRTYERTAQEAIYPFALETVAYQYAQILERLAPLYRELGNFTQSVAYFDDALAFLSTGQPPQAGYNHRVLLADHVGLNVDDVEALRSGLLRNRAHIWAVQGNEMLWRQDIQAAYRLAERAAPERRTVLVGLIQYSEGEGYKRLAYARRLAQADDLRARYARQALAAFDRERPHRAGQWYSHDLLARVAEAQCLVWLDPNEAILQAERLRETAGRISPGMLDKIARTITHARLRLTARRNESAPVLSLDHLTPASTTA